MTPKTALQALTVLALAACGSANAPDGPATSDGTTGTPIAQAQAPDDLAGAPDEVQPATDFTELCRPETVPAGELSIGPLTFSDDQVEAAVEDDGYGPVLQLRLDTEGATSLAELTQATLGQPLPLSVDGKVLMSPVVQEVIVGGALSVSGRFTRSELEEIAIRFADTCGTEGTRGARD